MSMTQLVSYGMTTVENPLSDGGNFTAVADGSVFTGVLKVVAGSPNLCENASNTTNAVSFWSGTVPTTVTWTNDQYSELTLTTINGSSSGNAAYIVVRQGAANVATQYLLTLSIQAATYSLAAGVGGTYHTLISATSTTISGTDVWRLSVAGNVLTITRNGSVIGSPFTDTNNYIASGKPGFGFVSTTVGQMQTILWAAGGTVPSGGGGSSSWLTVALANSLRGVRH